MYGTIIRRLGIVAAVAVTVAFGGAAPARAAVNPYTPQSLCGLGYVQVDQDPIHDARTGLLLGTVHLLHHPMTGYGCAVTLKSAYVGTPTRTQVYLTAPYLPTQVDDGPRLYAAGPVRAYLRGNCTIWGGLMADPDGTVHHHDRANPAIGGIGTCF
ncbi:hypothetical protein [Micromonospora coxensis]|uniref:hypothetical protein n=1 Tax=Micromonospora coxensis TaxID=356852 RepID=UPI00342EEEEA